MIVKFKCNNPENPQTNKACENQISKYFKTYKDIPPFLDCGECGTGKLERQLSAPTSKSTQIIDNGVQSRQVEVMDAVVENEKKRLNEE